MKTIHEQIEKYKNKIETIKTNSGAEKIQLLMNSVENLKIRLNNEGERITDLEAKTIEIIQSEEQKEKRMKKSETGRDEEPDIIKRNHI